MNQADSVTPVSYVGGMDSTVCEAASTDSLEQQLMADERLIGRIRHRQMATIEALDRRQTALADGCSSMVEWVASRIDVSPPTATAVVGTARRLGDQPGLADDLASGDVSFERAELLARLGASAEDLAHLDLGSLRRLVARQREIAPATEREVHDRRRVHLQPSLDRSRFRFWGELPGLGGTIVEEALFVTADRFPEEARLDSRATRNADALVAICQDALTGSGPETTTRPGVTVFVDATTPSETMAGYVAGGPVIGPNTLDELLCTGTVEVVTQDRSGRPLDVGRRSAKIPPRLRRFVLGRDDGCCADGCTSRYRLQAHHRTHWADGGRTDADNLVTLCWYHHHVVIHQRGHTIERHSPRQRLRFRAPTDTRAPP